MPMPRGFEKPYAAFLFDMDGTILNSIRAAERVWSDWARRHGLDVATFLPKMHGSRGIDTITRLNLPGVDPEHESKLVTEAEIADVSDVVAIPGAYTPTEMVTAWEAGADLIKLFPASALGPGYLRDLRGPLPQLRLVPTGGVTADNVGAYLAAGAVAVGVGGALCDRAALARHDYGRITAEARRLRQAIRAAREGSR